MEQEKIFEVLKDYKNKSNKDLLEILSFLNNDFYQTKELIIKLTKHLDSTEDSYNKILDELNNRVKK
jgi:hypothetical protein